jgi:hypothetical protein
MGSKVITNIVTMGIMVWGSSGNISMVAAVIPVMDYGDSPPGKRLLPKWKNTSSNSKLRLRA